MADQSEIHNLNMKTQDIKASLKMVTFKLNEGVFGVDVSQVHEVFTTSKITPIPKSPEHVVGVINLRGQIITIINLKRRLEIEFTPIDVENAKEFIILVIELGDKKIGMAIDGVESVISIPISKIETRIELISKDIQSFFLRGVAKVSDDDLVVVLNLDAVMSEYEIDQLIQMHSTMEEDVFRETDEVVLTDEEIKRLDVLSGGEDDIVQQSSSSKKDIKTKKSKKDTVAKKTVKTPGKSQIDGEKPNKEIKSGTDESKKDIKTKKSRKDSTVKKTDKIPDKSKKEREKKTEGK